MIIELYGPPCSGKTTFSNELEQKNLGFKRVQVNTRGELLYLNILFLFKHPKYFLVAFFYLIRNFQNFKIFYLNLMNSILLNNAKYEKAKRMKKPIIDQGYFQNIISLFKKEVTEEKIFAYAKNIPKPDLLIIFDIDNKTREERILNRGYKAREKFGDKYQKFWETITTLNNRKFIKVVDKLDVKYLILRNKEDKDNIFEILGKN